MAAETLTKTKREELLATLEKRFEKNKKRHAGIEWEDVQARLVKKNGALWSLSEMEQTGGEPDVISRDGKTGEFIFCDCSAESPAGRRSICYDGEGQKKRMDEGLPVLGNALDIAARIGIEVLTEDQYRELQKLGNFDAKSQSWLKTPEDVAKLGGAIFGDRRFGRVFVYHNTPHSFYRVRGFRGVLRV